jgi:hypothetical protein
MINGRAGGSFLGHRLRHVRRIWGRRLRRGLQRIWRVWKLQRLRDIRQRLRRVRELWHLRRRNHGDVRLWRHDVVVGPRLRRRLGIGHPQRPAQPDAGPGPRSPAADGGPAHVDQRQPSPRSRPTGSAPRASM